MVRELLVVAQHSGLRLSRPQVPRGCPTIGDFLAYQYITDLNYGALTNFDEMSFVVAGPGARDGLRKCFADFGGLGETDLIKLITGRQEQDCTALGLSFRNLWGRPAEGIFVLAGTGDGLAPAFANMLRVFCAEGARRRARRDLAEHIMADCTNAAFCQLYALWLERTAGPILV